MEDVRDGKRCRWSWEKGCWIWQIGCSQEMIDETLLLRGILLVIMMAFGWLWNGLVVFMMIRNGLPIRRAHQIAAVLPYGLSIYFTGVGIGLAISWYRDFQNGKYPDDKQNLLERLHNMEMKNGNHDRPQS